MLGKISNLFVEFYLKMNVFVTVAAAMFFCFVPVLKDRLDL